jgi:ribA/ribD-fused uncharacterized protein
MRDNCQVCLGTRGGVRGNENVIDGVITCDYCHADQLEGRKIEEFTGKNRFLSNFWPVVIEFEGLSYPSVEHAYQAAKTLDMKHREAIQGCRAASAAKKMGKNVTLRPDWDEVKLNIMLELVRKKFQKPWAGELLRTTGHAELIEGNWWGDTFWGVCKGVGENHLGRIIMQVREELRHQ